MVPLKQHNSTQHSRITLEILKREVRQFGNHVYSEQDPLAHLKRLQIGILGFSKKEIGAKRAAIATT